MLMINDTIMIMEYHYNCIIINIIISITDEIESNVYING